MCKSAELMKMFNFFENLEYDHETFNNQPSSEHWFGGNTPRDWLDKQLKDEYWFEQILDWIDDGDCDIFSCERECPLYALEHCRTVFTNDDFSKEELKSIITNYRNFLLEIEEKNESD